MNAKQIDLTFDRDKTEQENMKDIENKIEEIKQSGGYIIGEEPIQQIYSKVIGRRITFEYE